MSDIRSVRTAFVEMWPSVLDKVEAVIHESVPLPDAHVAFYHVRTVCQLHEKCARDLAGGRFEQALKDEEAIETLLNGEVMPDLSPREWEELLSAFRPVVQILGYGHSKSD